MGKVKDLTGQSFGRLTVVKQIGFGNKNKHGSRYANPKHYSDFAYNAPTVIEAEGSETDA